MLLGGVLALVGLAACDQVYGLHRPDGAPPNECPIVDDPSADSDNDGVLDGQDACPAVFEDSEVMHNEDDDCTGDACDLCPHVASTSDEDLDRDGIGANCDLDAATGGNVARFEGFDNLDEIIQVGAWNPASTADTLTNSSDALSIAYLNDPPTERVFRIDTRIDLLATDGDWYAGVVFGSTQTDADQIAYLVGLHRMNGERIRIGLYRMMNRDFQSLLIEQSDELALGSSVQLRIFAEASIVRVESLVDGTAISSSNFSIPIALGSATYYGPATKGPVRAAFRYLWHVQ